MGLFVKRLSQGLGTHPSVSELATYPTQHMVSRPQPRLLSHAALGKAFSASHWAPHTGTHFHMDHSVSWVARSPWAVPMHLITVETWLPGQVQGSGEGRWPGIPDSSVRMHLCPESVWHGLQIFLCGHLNPDLVLGLCPRLGSKAPT